MLPGGRRGRFATTDHHDMPSDGYYGDGGVGDDDFSRRRGGGGGGLPVSGGEDARLRVSLEGAQELGKGLGGHTVYSIQVK